MMRKLLCRVLKLWSHSQSDSVMKCWGWGGKKRDVALGVSMEEAWEQWLLSSQCAFTLRKSCLTNLFAFSVKTLDLLMEREQLVSSMLTLAFSMSCCGISCVWSVVAYMGGLVDLWKLNQGHWPQRVVLVIHALPGIWLQVWFLWGYVLEPFLFSILISNPEQKERKCPLSNLE